MIRSGRLSSASAAFFVFLGSVPGSRVANSSAVQFRIDHCLEGEFALVVFGTKVVDTLHACFFGIVRFGCVAVVRSPASPPPSTAIVATLTCGGWLCCRFGIRFRFGFRCGSFSFRSGARLLVRESMLQASLASQLSSIARVPSSGRFASLAIRKASFGVHIGYFLFSCFLWGEAQGYRNSEKRLVAPWIKGSKMSDRLEIGWQCLGSAAYATTEIS